MLITASLITKTATVWSACMKTISSLIILFIAAQASPNLFAEEAENTPVDAYTDSDAYLEEIKATCEAEAAGLPDAEDYVKNCIKAMKQSFSQ
jgi:ribosomal protein L7/L12